jgi:hypothetical protein
MDERRRAIHGWGIAFDNWGIDFDDCGISDPPATLR